MPRGSADTTLLTTAAFSRMPRFTAPLPLGLVESLGRLAVVGHIAIDTGPPHPCRRSTRSATRASGSCAPTRRSDSARDHRRQVFGDRGWRQGTGLAGEGRQGGGDFFEVGAD